MITAEEVVKSLPVLLKEHPALRTEIYEILSDEFVRRSEFYVYMDKSDERFERQLQELRAFREDTNRRFETVDKKFEEMREDMERRFEEVYHRFDKVDTDFKDLKDWVGIVVGGFQRRAGRNLEDAVAGTLRIALDKEVKLENIRMRTKIMDDDGMIGPKGRSYEIDLCVTNTESMIFEIKSYAEEEDIERFNDKAELALKHISLKKKFLPKRYYTLYIMKKRKGLQRIVLI